ncbi:hypothetical protein GF358_00075 [Candidatus Woesearchaeota archaeon]|nr:hypothetical protein [Candidatus Woesearchaeota archaeon]
MAKKLSLEGIKLSDIKEKKTDVSKLLSTLQKEKAEFTKEAIKDIEQQIATREQIHKEVLEELEKIKIELNNLMLSTSDMEEQEKQRIRQKQTDIEQLKVKEIIDKWKDIALLKKELRERMQEFKEKESKTEMMAKLLEEQ